MATGKRGDRESHVEALICEVTGAEAATAVNNNAAAVLLVLNTLALHKEVPVSRGELVEIGGSFLIPEVMTRAGRTLVEVGATNRTHLRDFRGAIGADTALLMKVHTSNYRVEGFTCDVEEDELAALASEHQIPFVHDLGSGNLVNFRALGLPDEPTAAQALANGADLITFSGDKPLGGPQAGLIAGRADLITQIKRNPLKRALRLDKMTLAALAEVLKLYRDPQTLTEHLPSLRLLTRPQCAIRDRAETLLPAVQTAVSPYYDVAVADCLSQIGSGSLPVETLPSAALHIVARSGQDKDLRHLADTLRQLPLPVIGRLHKNALWLDLRCLEANNSPCSLTSWAPCTCGTIATAGHVDHGKTSLIRQLTGVETDRLEEEKRRGLSITNGFAYLARPEEIPLGFIDVPGHQRFMNNMIAGISGIDTGLLVIAADDGPMPQTHEHMDVLELLGVDDLIVVISKIDRVDGSRLAALEQDITDMLARRPWTSSSIFFVSSIDGAGIDALKAELLDRAEQSVQRSSTGRFRLSIDRVFSVKGAGLIVTGTAAAGRIGVGDT